MAITLVTGNNKAAENDSGGTSLAAPAFTNNITTNNLLTVAIAWGSDGIADDATVDDGGVGLTWIRTETGPTYDSGNGEGVTIYYALITAGGGTKPTITAKFWTTTAHSVAKSVVYPCIHVAEWSGVATTSILDKHGTNLQTGVGDGSNIIVTPSSTVSPASNGQLVIGFTTQSGGAIGNGSFLSVGTNFTQLTSVQTVSPPGYFSETEYYIQPTASALQATWTQSGTSVGSDTLSLIATFNAAAGGGGTDTFFGQPAFLTRNKNLQNSQMVGY